jgi:hypothetical protein
MISLLCILDELDRVQRLLEGEFPECKVGYSYRAGHVSWVAQLGPVLNAASPDALRDAIKRAYVKVRAKISERVAVGSLDVRGAVLGDLREQPLRDRRLRVVRVDEHREPGSVLHGHGVDYPLSAAAMISPSATPVGQAGHHLREGQAPPSSAKAG